MQRGHLFLVRSALRLWFVHRILAHSNSVQIELSVQWEMGYSRTDVQEEIEIINWINQQRTLANLANAADDALQDAKLD
jgi:hypothetical protein